MSLFGLLLTVLIIFKQHVNAAGPPSSPPAPSLTQTNTILDSAVEVLCQAPHGHRGREFKLFKVQELIDTVKYSTDQQEARFILKGKNTEKKNLYCCQYGNSMFSAYMQPQLKVVDPVSPPPSPHLVVSPSSGHVMPGQTLSFHCQAPPESQKRPPDEFLLLRRGKSTPSSMVAPAKLVSRSQEAHFSVRTKGQEDEGEYVCLYQLKAPKTVNSTASPPVHVTVIELPVPTLALTRHKGQVLECVGSPSYPQGFFSLFRVGVLSPEFTHQASPTQHSARFPIPAHSGAQYQCQYSVALSGYWSYSKMSAPLMLPCLTGYHKCTPAPGTESTDLAMILGSVSVGVLFLMVMSLLGFAVHRHIKNLSVRRRKRKQEQLWKQMHSKDYVIDLTLQRIDLGSEDTGMLRGKPDPIYDIPMTTFKKPTVY